MNDPIASICEGVKRKNFDFALQQYSIFFQRLLTALFHEIEIAEDRGVNVVLENIINDDTNFHSAIVHFLYYMKYNDKTYITTKNCKLEIEEKENISDLLECENKFRQYIFLPPNFNIYLSHSLGVAISDLHNALQNNIILSEDILCKYSQLFANILNGYAKCSLNINTENIIWFRELKLIALLYRYFYLSYHKQEQERNWKDINIQNEIYNLQKEYRENYEKLRNDAISSLKRYQSDYDILLKSLNDTQNKLVNEQREKLLLNEQINENLQSANLTDLMQAIKNVKDIQDGLTIGNAEEKNLLIEDLKKKNIEIRNELENNNEYIQELRNELENNKKYIQDLQLKHNKELENKNVYINELELKYENINKGLENKIEELQLKYNNELENNNKYIQDLEQKYKKTMSEINEKLIRENAKVEKYEKELNECRDALKQSSDELNEYMNKLMAEKESELKKYKDSSSDNERKLRECKDELGQKNEQFNELTAIYKDELFKKETDFETQISKKDTEIKALEWDIKSRNFQDITSKREISKKDSYLHELKLEFIEKEKTFVHQIGEKDTEIESLQTFLQQLKNKMETLTSNLRRQFHDQTETTIKLEGKNVKKPKDDKKYPDDTTIFSELNDITFELERMFNHVIYKDSEIKSGQRLQEKLYNDTILRKDEKLQDLEKEIVKLKKERDAVIQKDNEIKSLLQQLKNKMETLTSNLRRQFHDQTETTIKLEGKNVKKPKDDKKYPDDTTIFSELNDITFELERMFNHVIYKDSEIKSGQRLQEKLYNDTILRKDEKLQDLEKEIVKLKKERDAVIQKDTEMKSLLQHEIEKFESNLEREIGSSYYNTLQAEIKKETMKKMEDDADDMKPIIFSELRSMIFDLEKMFKGILILFKDITFQNDLELQDQRKRQETSEKEISQRDEKLQEFNTQIQKLISDGKTLQSEIKKDIISIKGHTQEIEIKEEIKIEKMDDDANDFIAIYSNLSNMLSETEKLLRYILNEFRTQMSKKNALESEIQEQIEAQKLQRNQSENEILTKNEYIKELKITLENMKQKNELLVNSMRKWEYDIGGDDSFDESEFFTIKSNVKPEYNHESDKFYDAKENQIEGAMSLPLTKEKEKFVPPPPLPPERINIKDDKNKLSTKKELDIEKSDTLENIKEIMEKKDDDIEMGNHPLDLSQPKAEKMKKRKRNTELQRDTDLETKKLRNIEE